MTGKARTSKSVIDEVKQLKKDKSKNFGLQRQSISVYTSVGVPLASSGKKGGTDSNKKDNYLPTQSGTMIGPIAFYPKSKTISSGTLDISETTGSGFSSRVFVTGQGAAADDLVTISGAKHAGQILFLQAVETTDITLKHATGNIYIPSGSDYTVSGKEIVLLQYDSVNTTWTVVSNFTDSSGGTWVGTATSDLNMSNYDITGIANLDLDGVSATIEGIVNLQFYHTSNSINSISGDMYYQTNTSQQHQFLVAATPKLRITSSAIEADVGIDMNDNTLVQVQRIEFSNNSTDDITSTVDGIEYDVNSTDEHHFLVGGVEKLTVDSTEITLADDLNLSTNNILNSGVINFSVSGQNITPSSTELLYQVPTGDTHGFYVASTKVCEVNATYFEMQLNRFIDFGANITLSANSGFQTLPSNPVGFIKIRVNGGDARVPYYAV